MTRPPAIAGGRVIMSEPICAIASAPGSAARAIVRVSGEGLLPLLHTLFLGSEPVGVRGAYSGQLRDSGGLQPVELLWMPGPHSFTGEDVAELHLIGQKDLLARALDALHASGVRSAGPGEFTRRAFEHGRLDLAQAEGVMALVESQGRGAERAALALLSGGTSSAVAALRDQLEELRALCEASLDFDPLDTGHVPEQELAGAMGAILRELEGLRQRTLGRSVPQGLPRVVLLGAPNAGKSSLYNRLVTKCGGAEAPALISDLAGTTRDVHRSELDLEGQRILLEDTAGLVEDDPRTSVADSKAQELTQRVRAAADVWVLVYDGTLSDLETAPVHMLGQAPGPTADRPTIHVRTKADRPEFTSRAGHLTVSAHDGQGLGQLSQVLRGALAGDLDSEASLPGAVAARHRAGLGSALQALRGALESLEGQAPLDWVAEGLRQATDALDELTGVTTSEDVLDRIFARFCIGK